MSNLPLMASHNGARLPALPDYLHAMLRPLPIPSDRYTGKPLAQGTLFQLLPEWSLDVVVGLRESGQAGCVLKISVAAAGDLNPDFERYCQVSARR